MVRICKLLANSCLIGIFCLSATSSFGQIGDKVSDRLDIFMKESCEITYNKIIADPVEKILEHDVFYITQRTKNTYSDKEVEVQQFIVVDNGKNVKRFEHIKTNTSLPELTSYIRDDFLLNQETAPVFQSMLDYIYPIADWKPDKREFFYKNGKWYFLRDSYFRTKQGFEIAVDPKGKIISICYKMKWDEQESK